VLVAIDSGNSGSGLVSDDMDSQLGTAVGGKQLVGSFLASHTIVATNSVDPNSEPESIVISPPYMRLGSKARWTKCGQWGYNGWSVGDTCDVSAAEKEAPTCMVTLCTNQIAFAALRPISASGSFSNANWAYIFN
jgi:hypothetical protein